METGTIIFICNGERQLNRKTASRTRDYSDHRVKRNSLIDRHWLLTGMGIPGADSTMAEICYLSPEFYWMKSKNLSRTGGCLLMNNNGVLFQRNQQYVTSSNHLRKNNKRGDNTIKCSTPGLSIRFDTSTCIRLYRAISPSRQRRATDSEWEEQTRLQWNNDVDHGTDPTT